jgi:hypothetical protein
MWSNASKGQVGAELAPIIDTLYRKSAQRRQTYRDAYKMYGALSTGLVTRSRKHRLPVNVVRKVVDGFVTKVGKHLPSMVYIPNGGGYEYQTMADMRNGFLQALWAEDKLHKVARKAALDAAVCGLGVIKVLEIDGSVRHQRVFPEEIVIDPEDGKYGNPDHIFQVRGVARESLKAMFPSRKGVIDAAPLYIDTTDELEVTEQDLVVDRVQVYEAWHKGPKGRHVILVGEEVLLDEKWEDGFPFAMLRFTEQSRGFFTESLVTLLEDIQLQVNALVTMESENVKFHGMTRTWVPRGSKVKDVSITNTPGQLIEYDGPQPPVIQAPRLVSEDVYRQVANYLQEAYAIVGLSEMSATGQKPAGLNSGKALLTYQDVETQRFVLAVSNWEDMFSDIARLDTQLAERISKEDPSFAVTHTSKVWGTVQAKKYAFRDLGKNENFILRQFSSSSLPDSLPGRMEASEFLAKLGVFGTQEILKMLNLPDTDRDLALATVDVSMVDQDCSKILIGEDVIPDAKLDRKVALDRARRNYLLAKFQGADPDKLTKLLEYMDQLEQLQQVAEQQMMPPPQPSNAAMVTPQTVAMQAPMGVKKG